jgi:hypothetical protein
MKRIARVFTPLVVAALFTIGLSAQTLTPAQATKLKADVAKLIDALVATITPPTSTTRTIAAGSDLQAALNQAKPGDTLLLQEGATFIGNYVLPVKSGTTMITIRSSAADALLPATGARIAPSDAAHLPKIVSPSNQPALAFAAGAHHYTLLALEVAAHSDGEILAVGGDRDTQTTLAQVPHDIVIDRLYVHGDSSTGSKRGIALHGATVSILNSYVADIHVDGQDSQALAGWNGPGPYMVVNNYLEAASENVIFGGSDPGIPNNIPSDIVITGNTLAKPVAWRLRSWNVKNLFELKNARRVRVTNNVMEFVWSAAQTGYAVLFTPRNQDGRCPWCAVEDVLFQGNTIRHAAGALQIAGRDDGHPNVSGLLQRVQVLTNRFEDIDRVAWTGSSEATTQPIYIGRGTVDLTLDGNVFTGANWTNAVYFDEQPKHVRLKVTNNQWPPSFFGVNGSDSSPEFEDGRQVLVGGVPRAWTQFVDPLNSLFSGNVVR